MHLRPVDQRLVRPAQHLLQVSFGLLEFMLLQRAEPRLVALHRLCVSWILGHLFLGGYFQCHQTAFSSKFGSKSSSQFSSEIEITKLAIEMSKFGARS